MEPWHVTEVFNTFLPFHFLNDTLLFTNLFPERVNLNLERLGGGIAAGGGIFIREMACVKG